MPRKNILFVVIPLVLAAAVYSAYAFELPKWFPFNQRNALNEWQEKVFKGKVLYAVELKKEGGYLEANSNKACSGLFHKIKFDVKKYPLMSWNWKVEKFPGKGVSKETAKGWIERDDYAARVYVIFSGWTFLSIQSIEYIWDENLPEGKILTSPYFEGIKLIVAESGKKNLGKWVLEKRNVYEDYKKAFGRPPNRPVTAVALMTDSDNTFSTAEASYKDIKVGYKQ